MTSRASLVLFAPVAFARNEPEPATENLCLTNNAVFLTIGFSRICRASPQELERPKREPQAWNFDRIALLALKFPALSASA
jgi:hypothetical protein